jgi:hypothetical protein
MASAAGEHARCCGQRCRKHAQNAKGTALAIRVAAGHRYLVPSDRWHSVECERDEGEDGEDGKQRDLFHRSPSNKHKSTNKSLARLRHPGCDG